jgi:hypothetical protein
MSAKPDKPTDQVTAGPDSEDAATPVGPIRAGSTKVMPTWSSRSRRASGWASSDSAARTGWKVTRHLPKRKLSDVTVAAIYADTDDPYVALQIHQAAQRVLADLGYRDVRIGGVERGSVFWDLMCWLRSDVTSAPRSTKKGRRVQKDLEQLDPDALCKNQGAIDRIQTESVRHFLKKLGEARSFCIVLPPFYLLRYRLPDGSTSASVGKLNDEDRRKLIENPRIMTSPESFLNELSRQGKGEDSDG